MRLLSKSWFPWAVLLGMLVLVFLAARLPRPAAELPAVPDWTGSWDTRWQGGGATLHLEQRGERITGTYPLYEGTVTARVDGDRIRGKWVQPKRQGDFELLMAPDGRTFAGKFENEQYWNGERLELGGGRRFDKPDLRSPRDTIASFMRAVYDARRGQHERLQTAIACVDFGDQMTDVLRVLNGYVTVLYEVVGQTTFALSELLGTEDVHELNDSRVTLRQAGTGVAVELALQRDEKGDWTIVWPGAASLEAKRDELNAARGVARLDPNRHHDLQSPRATMQTFLEESRRGTAGSTELIERCLDLSVVEASVRELEAELHAVTLARLLDAIGTVHLWGIPDDPSDPLPYLHYSHAIGDIVIAPREIVEESVGATGEGGEARVSTRWVFTGETLAALRPLYDALEGFHAGRPELVLSDEPYFALRAFARSLSPMLVERRVALENWQWGGLALLLWGGWVAIGLVQLALRRLVLGSSHEVARAELDDSDGSSREWRFLVPMRITLTSAFWLYGLRYLGLPDGLQFALLTLMLCSAVIGGVWISIALISSASGRLLAKARRTQTRLDEILVTLLASIGKIAIVVVGLIVLAEGLALPYQSVLAGIGIGGLAVAIAARDTVANFFGSAVLISDRPFKRGDLVEVMGHLGFVERVGIRSTHIRTYEDSVVVIPNSSLVNELIDNKGRRRRRKVDVIIGVQYDSPPAKVQQLVDELRELVAKQPFGAGDATLAGLWDFGASSIDVRLWCYLEVGTLAEERIERHRLLLDIFRLVESLGLSFAFPTRTLHLDSVPAGAADEAHVNGEPIRLGSAPS